MEDIANQITQLYKETFTLEKVKADLFFHLTTNIAGLFDKNSEGYVLYA